MSERASDEVMDDGRCAAVAVCERVDVHAAEIARRTQCRSPMW